MHSRGITLARFVQFAVPAASRRATVCLQGARTLAADAGPAVHDARLGTPGVGCAAMQDWRSVRGRPRVRVADMALSITHTPVYCTDLDKALAFYTQRLGFEVHDDVAMGPEMPWLPIQS